MKALTRPWPRGVAALALVATCVAVAAGTGSAAATATLPNPCTLLVKVHPEHTLTRRGKRLVGVGRHKLARYGTGKQASSTCSETIGAVPVYLSVSLAAPGGFGGVAVTSTTHPAGLGSNDMLVIGKSPTGGPVDFIAFHSATVYASLSANGATPASLTTLARQVYKLLH